MNQPYPTKKYRRLLDPLNFSSFRFEHKEELKTWMDKLAGHSFTFQYFDSVYFRRKVYKTSIGETFYYTLMSPTYPVLDILTWIISPLLSAFGMTGQTKLPDLGQFQTSTPDDAFEPAKEPASNRDRRKDLIEPAMSGEEASVSTHCDGHYLFVEGFHTRNMVLFLPTIILVPFAIYVLYVLGGQWLEAIDNGYLFFDLGPFNLEGILFLSAPFLGFGLWAYQWYPHQKGALFDRNRQLVTFFRGRHKPPITVPYRDIQFISHLTGTGNLTRGLTLECKRKLKGQRKPLRLQLVTGGGRKSDLHAEVGAINTFMDLENLGGFSWQFVRAIHAHRKHGLTLWRLCWKHPPPEIWAEYQQPESLYQIDFQVGSDAWKVARNPEVRAIREKRAKIDLYAELYFNEQENSEPELIEEVETRWPEEGFQKVSTLHNLHQYALRDLKKLHTEKNGSISQGVQDLQDYVYEHLPPVYSLKDIPEFREKLKDYEKEKSRLLKMERIHQEDYDFLVIKNYRPIWEAQRAKRIEELNSIGRTSN